MKTYVVVEGHGEVQAVLNLLTRLRVDLKLRVRPWSEPIRGRQLLNNEGIRRYAEAIRARDDCDGLLVLCDDEDGCPKEDAPRLAEALSVLDLPFPAAVVLAYREYESLFLPCIPLMAGKKLAGDSGTLRPGLSTAASWIGPFEDKRDVKGWLSSQMSPGRIYKPRLDQLPLTRLVDFEVVRAAKLPWFASLENALRAIDAGQPGSVYPARYGQGGQGSP